MIAPLLLRFVAWLVPDDFRGRALIGDLSEIYENHVISGGPTAAGCYLITEIARSAPALFWGALIERGGEGLVLRTLPALLVGCAVIMAPFGVAGEQLTPTGAGIVLLVLAVWGMLAVTGGFLAAVIAGAAPRQHGFAVGILVGVCVAALVARGHVPMSLMELVMVECGLAAASTCGGHIHWRATRRRIASWPGGSEGIV